MSYAFSKCLAAQTAFETTEELFIRFLDSLITSIISPFSSSFGKFNITVHEESHLCDLLSIIRELYTFHKHSHNNLMLSSAVSSVSTDIHTHSRNQLQHLQPQPPISPPISGQTTDCALHSTIFKCYRGFNVVYAKYFDTVMRSLSRLSAIITSRRNVTKWFRSRYDHVLPCIAEKNTPYRSLAQILRDIVQHGYAQTNRLQEIANSKYLRNSADAKEWKDNSFMKKWDKTYEAKFALLHIELCITSAHSSSEQIRIYEDDRRLMMLLEVQIPTKARSKRNLFGLNKKTNQTQDGLLYIFNDMVLICSKEHNKFKGCYDLASSHWSMQQSADQKCITFTEDKKKLSVFLSKMEECRTAFDTIQQYQHNAMRRSTLSDEFIVHKSPPIPISPTSPHNYHILKSSSYQSQSQSQSASQLEANTKYNRGSMQSATYSILTENTIVNDLSEPRTSNAFSIQQTPITQEETLDEDEIDMKRAQFEQHRSAPHGRRFSVPLSSIASSGNDEEQTAENESMKRSKSFGVQLHPQVRFDAVLGDIPIYDEAEAFTRHEIENASEEEQLMEEHADKEKERKAIDEIDLNADETPSIDAKQLAEDPYGVLNVDTEGYTCEDDYELKMKLLLQPQWAKKSANRLTNGVDEEFEVREYPQVSAEEYYTMHREVLDPVKYAHKMHVHKQQTGANTDAIPPHTFDRFLQEMTDYVDKGHTHVLNVPKKKKKKHDRIGSRELYYFDDDDEEMVESPDVPMQTIDLADEVSTLVGSPSELFVNDEAINAAAADEAGNEFELEQHVLDRWNLQTNNLLLLAEVGRLRSIIGQQREDMTRVEGDVEILNESIQDKEEIAKSLRSSNAMLKNQNKEANKELIRLKQDNDRLQNMLLDWQTMDMDDVEDDTSSMMTPTHTNGIAPDLLKEYKVKNVRNSCKVKKVNNNNTQSSSKRYHSLSAGQAKAAKKEHLMRLRDRHKDSEDSPKQIDHLGAVKNRLRSLKSLKMGNLMPQSMTNMTPQTSQRSTPRNERMLMGKTISNKSLLSDVSSLGLDDTTGNSTNTTLDWGTATFGSPIGSPQSGINYNTFPSPKTLTGVSIISHTKSYDNITTTTQHKKHHTNCVSPKSAHQRKDTPTPSSSKNKKISFVYSSKNHLDTTSTPIALENIPSVPPSANSSEASEEAVQTRRISFANHAHKMRLVEDDDKSDTSITMMNNQKKNKLAKRQILYTKSANELSSAPIRAMQQKNQHQSYQSLMRKSLKQQEIPEFFCRAHSKSFSAQKPRQRMRRSGSQTIRSSTHTKQMRLKDRTRSSRTTMKTAPMTPGPRTRARTTYQQTHNSNNNNNNNKRSAMRVPPKRRSVNFTPSPLHSLKPSQRAKQQLYSKSPNFIPQHTSSSFPATFNSFMLNGDK